MSLRCNYGCCFKDYNLGKLAFLMIIAVSSVQLLLFLYDFFRWQACSFICYLFRCKCSLVTCFSFQDESNLIWFSGKEEKHLKLGHVSRIIPGQRTVSSTFMSCTCINDAMGTLRSLRDQVVACCSSFMGQRY